MYLTTNSCETTPCKHPHRPVSGTKWLDNHKGLFNIMLTPVSSLHTQDRYILLGALCGSRAGLHSQCCVDRIPFYHRRCTERCASIFSVIWTPSSASWEALRWPLFDCWQADSRTHNSNQISNRGGRTHRGRIPDLGNTRYSSPRAYWFLDPDQSCCLDCPRSLSATALIPECHNLSSGKANKHVYILPFSSQHYQPRPRQPRLARLLPPHSA